MKTILKTFLCVLICLGVTWANDPASVVHTRVVKHHYNYPLSELGDTVRGPNLRVQDIKPGVLGQVAYSGSDSLLYGTLGGDLSGSMPSPTLTSIITAAGPIGDGTHVPIITYDAKGRLTGVSTAVIPVGSTTLAGLTDVALSGLAGGHILVYDNATSKWKNYAVSGDGSLAAGVLTLTTVNSSPGTYGDSTHYSTYNVDAKGRVIGSAQVANSTIAINGDVGGNLGSSVLATVNSAPGSYGDSTHYPTFTVTGKGLQTVSGQVANSTIGIAGDVTGNLGATVLATVNSSPGSYGDSTHYPTFTVNGKGLNTVSGQQANTGIAIAGDVTGTLGASTVGKINGVAYNLDPLTQYILASGVRAFTGDQSLGGHALTNVADPSNAQDAATKAYVDAVATGLSPKNACRLATTAALPTNTYANGSSGVGATLTGSATGVLTIDGSTVALNDRVLVKDEASGLKNGIYKCTTAGAVGVAYVLTRATDADTSAEIWGAYTFVTAGTANASAGYVDSNATSPTMGTTSITFTQFSGAGEITAGTALSKSGNVLNVVNDGSTILVNGSNQIYVAAIDASIVASGILPPVRGGTGSNLSATGGTSQVLKQTSVGGNITVGQLAASDLSNGTTGSGGGVVLATGPTLSAPILGTPASGTLTNCTGLPASGITGGTANRIMIDGGTTGGWSTNAYPLPSSGDTLVGRASTDTLTNKRITKRVHANSAANSLTPNIDNYDIEKITLTSGTAFTLNAPTGTPTDGQMLCVQLTWLSGASPAYTFNSAYVGSTGLALPTAGSVSKTDYLLFIYSTDATKYRLIGLVQGF